MDILLITETNFILDITFEQSQQCERLLPLVKEYRIPLVIPEYAVAEAEGNISNTLQKRFDAIDSAISALKQSARSAYQEVRPLIEQLEAFKVQSEHVERPLLHTKITVVEEHASIIPFTPEIAVRAELRGLRQLPPFKSSDRCIYESILHFARENHAPDITMLLLTRDRNDFDYPSIHQELSAYSVELRFSAGDCIKRLRELVESSK